MIVSMTGAGMDAQQAFEDFYQENYWRVLGWLRKRITSFQDAEDLTSVVFTYCYQNWDRFDPSKASRSSWLFMIVNSRWKNYCRDRRVFADIDELSEVLGDDNDPIEQAANLADIRQKIADVLQELPERSRQAVIMKYFGDKSDQEIADALDTTPGNVRVICSRAMKTMRMVLGDALMEE